jgi:beta-galactosidase
MGDDLQIVWKVPYRPGTLEVKAYDGERTVATKTVKTAGAPYRIMIRSDRQAMAANRRDVAHLEVDIVDEEGTLVPYAADTVWFAIEGPARLLGVENGDILDLSPHYVPCRKVFKGKCLLVIQSTDRPGTISVEAIAKGLRAETVQISVKK